MLLYVRGSPFRTFLQQFVPVVDRLLRESLPCTLEPDSPVYAAQVAICEVLIRLPAQDAFGRITQQHALVLGRLCVHLLSEHAEVVGSFGVKLLHDLLRPRPTDMEPLPPADIAEPVVAAALAQAKNVCAVLPALTTAQSVASLQGPAAVALPSQAALAAVHAGTRQLPAHSSIALLGSTLTLATMLGGSKFWETNAAIATALLKVNVRVPSGAPAAAAAFSGLAASAQIRTLTLSASLLSTSQDTTLVKDMVAAAFDMLDTLGPNDVTARREVLLTLRALAKRSVCKAPLLSNLQRRMQAVSSPVEALYGTASADALRLVRPLCVHALVDALGMLATGMDGAILSTAASVLMHVMCDSTLPVPVCTRAAASLIEVLDAIGKPMQASVDAARSSKPSPEDMAKLRNTLSACYRVFDAALASVASRLDDLSRYVPVLLTYLRLAAAADAGQRIQHRADTAHSTIVASAAQAVSKASGSDGARSAAQYSMRPELAAPHVSLEDAAAAQSAYAAAAAAASVQARAELLSRASALLGFQCLPQHQGAAGDRPGTESWLSPDARLVRHQMLLQFERALDASESLAGSLSNAVHVPWAYGWEHVLGVIPTRHANVPLEQATPLEWGCQHVADLRQHFRAVQRTLRQCLVWLQHSVAPTSSGRTVGYYANAAPLDSMLLAHVSMLRCMRLYTHAPPFVDHAGSSSGGAMGNLQDACRRCAEAMVATPAHQFQDLFKSILPLLMRKCMAAPALLQILHNVLAHQEFQGPIISSLAPWLVQHVHLLNADPITSVGASLAAVVQSARQADSEPWAALPAAPAHAVKPLAPPAVVVEVRADPTSNGMLPRGIAPSDMQGMLHDPLSPFVTANSPLASFAPVSRSRCVHKCIQLVLVVVGQQHPHLLQDYWLPLIMGILRDAQVVSNVSVHITLLRSLFRMLHFSASSEQYRSAREETHQQLAAVLPTIHHHLMALHDRIRQPHAQHQLVDLCLTMPARLEHQLPRLHLWLHATAIALHDADKAAVDTALHLLEIWLDNLDPAYLFQQIKRKNLAVPLFTGLLSHLTPPPVHALPQSKSAPNVVAVRILGKMGGRGRAFLLRPPRMPALSPAPQDMALAIQPAGARSPLVLRMGVLLSMVLRVLNRQFRDAVHATGRLQLERELLADPLFRAVALAKSATQAAEALPMAKQVLRRLRTLQGDNMLRSALYIAWVPGNHGAAKTQVRVQQLMLDQFAPLGHEVEQLPRAERAQPLLQAVARRKRRQRVRTLRDRMSDLPHDAQLLLEAEDSGSSDDSGSELWKRRVRAAGSTAFRRAHFPAMPAAGRAVQAIEGSSDDCSSGDESSSADSDSSFLSQASADTVAPLLKSSWLGAALHARAECFAAHQGRGTSPWQPTLPRVRRGHASPMPAQRQVAQQAAWRTARALLALALGQLHAELPTADELGAATNSYETMAHALGPPATQPGDSGEGAPLSPAQVRARIAQAGTPGAVAQDISLTALRQLILAVCIASGDAYLQAQAQPVFRQLVRHLVRAAMLAPKLRAEHTLLPAVITHLLAGDVATALTPVALAVVRGWADGCAALAAAAEHAQADSAPQVARALRQRRSDMARALFERVAQLGYQHSWQAKLACGSLLAAMPHVLPRDLVAASLASCSKALLYVLRDAPLEYSVLTMHSARVALDALTRHALLPAAMLTPQALSRAVAQLPDGSKAAIVRVPVLLSPGNHQASECSAVSEAAKGRLVGRVSVDAAAADRVSLRFRRSVNDNTRTATMSLLVCGASLHCLGVHTGPTGRSISLGDPDTLADWLCQAAAGVGRSEPLESSPLSLEEAKAACAFSASLAQHQLAAGVRAAADEDAQIAASRSQHAEEQPDLAGIGWLADGEVQRAGWFGTLPVWHVTNTACQAAVDGMARDRLRARSSSTADVSSAIQPGYSMVMSTTALLKCPASGEQLGLSLKDLLLLYVRSFVSHDAPARAAATALLYRLSALEGKELEELLAPFAVTVRQIVLLSLGRPSSSRPGEHDSPMAKLTGLTLLGAAGALLHVLRHAHQLIVGDEQFKTCLMGLFAQHDKGQDRLEKAMAGVQCANPKVRFEACRTLSAAPYAWPDPLEMGWPRGSASMGDTMPPLLDAGLVHDRAAPCAYDRSIAYPLEQTAAAVAASPFATGQSSSFILWRKHYHRLASCCTKLRKQVMAAQLLERPDCLSAETGFFADLAGSAPALSAAACPADFADGLVWAVPGGLRQDAAFTRGMCCLYPSVWDGCIGAEALLNQVTMRALQVSAVFAPAVDFKPPPAHELLRACLFDLYRWAAVRVPALISAGAEPGQSSSAQSGADHSGPAWTRTPGFAQDASLLRKWVVHMLATAVLRGHQLTLASAHFTFSFLLSDSKFPRAAVRKQLWGKSAEAAAAASAAGTDQAGQGREVRTDVLREALSRITSECIKCEPEELRRLCLILTLLADFFNHRLADSLTSHLKAWAKFEHVTGPSSSGSASSSGSGRSKRSRKSIRLDTAVELVNLQALLPWTTGSSEGQPQLLPLWNVVRSACKHSAYFQEAGCLQNPLIVPLARVMSRAYDNAVSALLSEQFTLLIDPGMSHLSMQALAHPDAATVRRSLRMASTTGKIATMLTQAISPSSDGSEMLASHSTAVRRSLVRMISVIASWDRPWLFEEGGCLLAPLCNLWASPEFRAQQNRDVLRNAQVFSEARALQQLALENARGKQCTYHADAVLSYAAGLSLGVPGVAANARRTLRWELPARMPVAALSQLLQSVAALPRDAGAHGVSVQQLLGSVVWPACSARLAQARAATELLQILDGSSSGGGGGGGGGTNNGGAPDTGAQGEHARPRGVSVGSLAEEDMGQVSEAEEEDAASAGAALAASHVDPSCPLRAWGEPQRAAELRLRDALGLRMTLQDALARPTVYYQAGAVSLAHVLVLLMARGGEAAVRQAAGAAAAIVGPAFIEAAMPSLLSLAGSADDLDAGRTAGVDSPAGEAMLLLVRTIPHLPATARTQSHLLVRRLWSALRSAPCLSEQQLAWEGIVTFFQHKSANSRLELMEKIAYTAMRELSPAHGKPGMAAPMWHNAIQSSTSKDAWFALALPRMCWAVQQLLRLCHQRLPAASQCQLLREARRKTLEDHHDPTLHASAWMCITAPEVESGFYTAGPLVANFAVHVLDSMLSQNAGNVPKHLGLRMAQVVMRWHTRAQLVHLSHAATAGPAAPAAPGMLTPDLAEFIMTYVARSYLHTAHALSPIDLSSTPRYSAMCMQHLRSVVALFPGACVKPSHLPSLEVSAVRQAGTENSAAANLCKHAGKKRCAAETPAAAEAAMRLFQLMASSWGSAGAFFPLAVGHTMKFMAAAMPQQSACTARAMRRFLALLMRAHPLHLPAARMRKVRLYSWLAMCIALRLGTACGQAANWPRGVVNLASEAAEPATRPTALRVQAAHQAARAGLLTEQQLAPGTVLQAAPDVAPDSVPLGSSEHSQFVATDDDAGKEAWKDSVVWICWDTTTENLWSVLRLARLLWRSAPELLDSLRSEVLYISSILLSEHLQEANAAPTFKALADRARALRKPPVVFVGMPIVHAESVHSQFYGDAVGSSTKQLVLDRELALRERIVALAMSLTASRSLALDSLRQQSLFEFVKRMLRRSTSVRLVTAALRCVALWLSEEPLVHLHSVGGLSAGELPELLAATAQLMHLATDSTRSGQRRLHALNGHVSGLHVLASWVVVHAASGNRRALRRMAADIAGWVPYLRPGEAVARVPAATVTASYRDLLVACLSCADMGARLAALDLLVLKARASRASSLAEWQQDASRVKAGFPGRPRTADERARLHALRTTWLDVLQFAAAPAPLELMAPAERAQWHAAHSALAKAGPGQAVNSLLDLLSMPVEAIMRLYSIALPTTMLLRAASEAVCADSVATPQLAGAVRALHGGEVDVASATQELLHALLPLAYASLEVARELWGSLFEYTWSALPAWHQGFFLPHMSSWLTRDAWSLQSQGYDYHATELLANVHVRAPGAGRFAVPDVAPDIPISCGTAPVGHCPLPAYALQGQALQTTAADAVEAALPGPYPAIAGTATISRKAWGANTLQLLLEGMARVWQRLPLRPEILAYLGRTFNCWDIVLPWLEQLVSPGQMRLLPASAAAESPEELAAGATANTLLASQKEPGTTTSWSSSSMIHVGLPIAERGQAARQRVSVSASHPPMHPGSASALGAQDPGTAIAALQQLYDGLGEADMQRGLLARFGSSGVSQIGALMEAGGRWAEARDVYTAAFAWAGGETGDSAEAPSGPAGQPAGAAAAAEATPDAPSPGLGLRIIRLRNAAHKQARQPAQAEAPATAAMPGHKRSRKVADRKWRAKRFRLQAAFLSQACAQSLDIDHVAAGTTAGAEPRALRTKLRGPARRAQMPERPVSDAETSLLASADLQAMREQARAAAAPVTLWELDGWEAGWVECARQLLQWPELRQYAEHSMAVELAAEAFSKLGEWESLERLMQTPDMRVYVDSSAKMSLLEVELTMATQPSDSHVKSAIDGLSKGSLVSMLLRSWAALPESYVAYGEHTRILELTHRVRELAEASGVLRAVSNSMRNSSRPNVKPVLDDWRERLPNRWDGLRAWDDILTWRHHVFLSTVTTLQAAAGSGVKLDATEMQRYHDASWTVLQSAHVARKLGLHQTCMHTLTRLMPVDQFVSSEAARKTRETISVALDAARAQTGQRRLELLRASLHAVSELDVIGQWELPHRSAWAQLRGTVLAEMSEWEPGLASDARVMFVTAAALHARNGKAWVAWGKFLHRVYLGLDGVALPPALATHAPVSAGEQDLQQAQWPVIARGAAGADASASLESVAKQLAQQAASAYIMGVSFRVAHSAAELGRLLSLAADERVAEAVGKSLNDFGGGVPSWTWLPWLPTIASLLVSGASRAAQDSLSTVARRFAQPVYFLVRLKRRELRAVLERAQLRAVKACPVIVRARDGSYHRIPAGVSEAHFAAHVKDRLEVCTSASASVNVTRSTPKVPFPKLDDSTRVPPEAAQQAYPAEVEHSQEARQLVARCQAVKAADYVRVTIESDFPGLENQLKQFSLLFSTRLLGHAQTGVTEEQQLRTLKAALYMAKAMLPIVSRIAQQLVQLAAPAAAQGGFEALAAARERTAAALQRCMDPALHSDLQPAPDLVAAWQAAYQEQLEPLLTGDAQQCSVARLVRALRVWRQRCAAILCKTVAQHTALYSGSIAEQRELEVTIPGSFTGLRTLSADMFEPARIARVMSNCQAVLGYDAHHISKRFTLLGTDGRRYPFSAQQSSFRDTLSDMRARQLTTMLTYTLNRHAPARARFLSVHAPAVVPMEEQCNITAVGPSMTSVADVAEAAARAAGLPDWNDVVTYLHAAEAGAGHGRWLSEPAAVQAGFAAVQSSMPAGLVADWVARALSTPAAFAQFRAMFARTHAGAGMLHTLTACAPQRAADYYVDLSTAREYCVRVRGVPMRGEVPKLEPGPVPLLRLTPEVLRVLGAVGTAGPLALSYSAAAGGALHRAEWLQAVLSCWLRDELLALHFAEAPEDDHVVTQAALQHMDVQKQTAKAGILRLRTLCAPDSSQVAEYTQRLQAAGGAGPGMPAPEPPASVYTTMANAASMEQLLAAPVLWRAWL